MSDRNLIAIDLAKMIYIAPWQEPEQEQDQQDETIVLHSLFGNAFDPVMSKALGQ
ncbi:MAG: hypothetical protein L3J89_12205 [Gammaproteobacteria bacterium]|nr:hypothetical protein [Gammaproteobacteria bacterium]